MAALKGDMHEMWKYSKYTKCLILLLAICFIVIGIGRGEAGVVLKKAINICLECIGIG